MSDSPAVNSTKSLCTSHVTAAVPKEPFLIECDSNDISGRYVFIEGQSKHLPLEVCDVEVFGSPGRNIYFNVIIICFLEVMSIFLVFFLNCDRYSHTVHH